VLTQGRQLLWVYTPTLEMEGQTLTQTTDGTEFRIIRVLQGSSEYILLISG
jgi:hypothetical protein